MLAPKNLLKQFATGLVETECPRCGSEVEVPFGQVCQSCRLAVTRRAKRIARWTALVTTAAVGIYAHLRMPDDPTSRTIGAVAVLLWYAFSYTAVVRAARLLLK